MRLLVVTALLGGCTDYDLNRKVEEPAPSEGEDTAPPPVDTAPPEDTAPEDTGGGTVPIPDTGEIATEAVYINTSDTLYSYDPATGVATTIGRFSGSGTSGGITDIAIDLDGIMFAVSYEMLFRVNPTTAECTPIASVDDSLVGLTFVSDGRLVGAGSAVSFVDTRTGALTPLVGAGEYSTSGDIVGLPDGMLYWSVTGGDQLVQVDPDTGDTRRRGGIGTTGVYGLGYAYGDLLGFTSGGEVLVIDESSGRTSSTERLSGSWWGATTNPVLW